MQFPTHIFYADDIFIFAKATSSNVAALASILDFYAAVSGQVCSPDKSRVFLWERRAWISSFYGATTFRFYPRFSRDKLFGSSSI